MPGRDESGACDDRSLGSKPSFNRIAVCEVGELKRHRTIEPWSSSEQFVGGLALTQWPSECRF